MVRRWFIILKDDPSDKSEVIWEGEYMLLWTGSPLVTRGDWIRRCTFANRHEGIEACDTYGYNYAGAIEVLLPDNWEELQ